MTLALNITNHVNSLPRDLSVREQFQLLGSVSDINNLLILIFVNLSVITFVYIIILICVLFFLILISQAVTSCYKM